MIDLGFCKIHTLTDAMCDSYVAWMKGAAIKALEEVRHLYTAENYAAERHALSLDFATGAYGFGGAIYEAFANGGPGKIQFLRVITAQPTLSDEDAAKLLLEHGKEIDTAFRTLHGIPLNDEAADPGDETPAPKA